jgi:hypothetical protein
LREFSQAFSIKSTSAKRFDTVTKAVTTNITLQGRLIRKISKIICDLETQIKTALDRDNILCFHQTNCQMGYNSSSLHSIKSIDGSAIVIHFVF